MANRRSRRRGSLINVRRQSRATQARALPFQERAQELEPLEGSITLSFRESAERRLYHRPKGSSGNLATTQPGRRWTTLSSADGARELQRNRARKRTT